MATNGAVPESDLPAPSSRMWWIVPAAAFLLLVILAMIIGPPPEPGGHGTSYDPGHTGFRAAYLILEELQFPVERSRQATGGAVRWVLIPKGEKEQEFEPLDGWVRRGGVVLLAAAEKGVVDPFGLGLRVRPAADDGIRPAAGVDFESLDVGDIRVDIEDADGREWEGVRVDGQPLVTIVPHDQGEIWVLHRPGVLRNQQLRHPGNAVLACRLAEAMLQRRPGRLAFDEYCHGLRQRPGVSELLLRPPALAATLQAAALTALLIWYFAPRFGPLRPPPPPTRRSKEEFLDAMALLLQQRGARVDAFRTVQDDLRRKIAADLGLPAGIPVEQMIHEAVRRRGIRPEPLVDLLSDPRPPGGPGPGALIDALHQLETARHEYFQRAFHRPR
jgi:hypothetical protein